MGRLIDGEWYTDADRADRGHGGDGAFQREETSFRDWVRAPGAEVDPAGDASAGGADAADPFTAEAGRYHLYVSYACPWAHRTLVTRAILGLDDAVSVDVVDPVRIDQGWEFAPGKDGCTPDSQFGADYLREVYTRADPDYTGRVTVPVLWDTERGTIVNNESAEIITMFATAFRDVAGRDVDLYPVDQREEIDAVIEDVYERINNGVYRAGFAGSQAAYDEAVAALFDAMAEYDEVLADRRYLLGESLTLADVCLFPTLFRFDSVYHTHFRCNRRRVVDYPNLWGFARELYRLPGVAATCRLDHCTTHYYRSHADLNPTGIVPVGPDLDFDAPHDRDRLPGGPPAALREVTG